MATIFISYSHVDHKSADELVSLFGELQIDYFRDVKDIKWGDSIPSKVRDGLDSCRAVLVIVSPASLKSHWVPYEIGYASALRKTILPFLTHPSLDVPNYISDLIYATTIEKVRDYFTNTFDRETKDIAQPTEAGPMSHSVTLSDLQIDYLLEISKPRNDGSICGDIDEQTGRDVVSWSPGNRSFGLAELASGSR